MQKIDLKDTLTSDDLSFLHDTILEALGYSPSEDDIKKQFTQLPQRLKKMAYFWGCGDTCFRDEMYKHLIERNNDRMDK